MTVTPSRMPPSRAESLRQTARAVDSLKKRLAELRDDVDALEAAGGGSVTYGSPVAISDSTNSDGTGTDVARDDHVHAHGNRGGGSLHSAATGATAGFMSAADKAALDAIEAGGPASDLFLRFGCNTAQNLVYLPLNGSDTAATTVGIGFANWLAPYDCTVVEAVLQCISLDYDSTVVTPHVDSGAAVDSDTQELDVAAGNVTFTLGTDVDAGQRLAVGFDALTNGGELCGYVRIRRR